MRSTDENFDAAAALALAAESRAAARVRVKRVLTGNVLLVDDDADVRDIASRILSGAGLGVTTANDGEEAWSALCSASFDLLITDHNMPKLTGVDLIKRMRESRQPIPSMIISGGLPFDETSDEGLSAAGSYLAKPFTPAQLLEHVDHLLSSGLSLARAS